MSMFTDLVKQGKVGSLPKMSLASKLNLVVRDIIAHGGKIPFTFHFVKKDDETAHLKVTLADGTEPMGAVVIIDLESDGWEFGQTVAFFHPNFTGKEAWKLANGTDDEVLALANNGAREEARFRHKRGVSTPWSEVDASCYDVVNWCIRKYRQ